MSRFDEWLAANGKVRKYATDMDEIQWLREDRQRLRLTDVEREAIEWAAFEFDAVRPDNGRAAERAATLRGLLERHGTADSGDSHA